jgi:molecular chaperone GrpE (heat shock protein)
MEICIYMNEKNMLPPANLVADIEILQEDLLVERGRNLRTFAEFKNYHRRIVRDGIKLAEENKQGTMLPLFDIIDDLEKSLL